MQLQGDEHAPGGRDMSRPYECNDLLHLQGHGMPWLCGCRENGCLNSGYKKAGLMPAFSFEQDQRLSLLFFFIFLL